MGLTRTPRWDGRSITQRAAVLSAALLAASCGDRLADDGSTDAGDTTVATDSDGESGTDGETGTDSVTGPGDTTDGTDTGPQECELPQGDEPGSEVATITIENTSDETVFVTPYSQIGCNYSNVEILIDGEPAHWDTEFVYAFTCDACGWGCSDGGSQGFIINPGATAEVPWNGSVWTNTDFPEACAADACNNEPGWGDNPLPTECEVLQTHASVEYTARAHVTHECPLFESQECDCPGDVCEIFFYEPQPSMDPVEATAVFPAGAAIVVE